MEVILYIVIYIIGASATVGALEDQTEDSVWNNPVIYFMGLFWPVMLPAILGHAVRKRLTRGKLPEAKLLRRGDDE